MENEEAYGLPPRIKFVMAWPNSLLRLSATHGSLGSFSFARLKYAKE